MAIRAVASTNRDRGSGCVSIGVDGSSFVVVVVVVDSFEPLLPRKESSSKKRGGRYANIVRPFSFERDLIFVVWSMGVFFSYARVSFFGIIYSAYEMI